MFGIRNGERVVAFIDGANLYSGLRSAGIDVDFKRVLTALNTGNLLRAYYYTAMADTDDFNSVRPLVDWLGYNGYQVVTKSVREHTDHEGRRRIKNNMNVEMTLDAMDIIDRVDHVVLFSGDGDLAPLVSAIQRKGVRVSVVADKSGTSSTASEDLRRVADAFFDLSNDDVRDAISKEHTNHTPGFLTRSVNTPARSTRAPARA